MIRCIQMSTGCQLYGMFVCFFGLVSIMTFSAIAFERCIVITSKPLGAKWKVTRSRAKKVINGQLAKVSHHHC